MEVLSIVVKCIYDIKHKITWFNIYNLPKLGVCWPLFRNYGSINRLLALKLCKLTASFCSEVWCWSKNIGDICWCPKSIMINHHTHSQHWIRKWQIWSRHNTDTDATQRKPNLVHGFGKGKQKLVCVKLLFPNHISTSNYSHETHCPVLTLRLYKTLNQTLTWDKLKWPGFQDLEERVSFHY